MKQITIVVYMLLLSYGFLFSFTGFAESPIFEINDETLPVTLSSFMAIPNVNNHSISIHWTTHSESNLIGYHIHRAETNLLATATKITFNVIPAINSQLTSDYSYDDDGELEAQITYYYWLQSINYSNYEFFGPISAKIDNLQEENPIEELILGNNLYSNYPNPFNPTTTISYSLAEPSNVSIDVFNIKGQKIKKLFFAYVQEVNVKHNIVWDGTDSVGNGVTSGIYFAKIKTASFTKTTKMLLSK